MKDQIVSLEVAKLLKELGFDWECRTVYDTCNPEDGFETLLYYEGDGSGYVKNSCMGTHEAINLHEEYITAPTQSLAQKWMREKYVIIVGVYANASGYCYELHYSPEKGGTHIKDSGDEGPNDSGCWDSYEEALEAGLLASLNHLK